MGPKGPFPSAAIPPPFRETPSTFPLPPFFLPPFPFPPFPGVFPPAPLAPFWGKNTETLFPGKKGPGRHRPPPRHRAGAPRPPLGPPKDVFQFCAQFPNPIASVFSFGDFSGHPFRPGPAFSLHGKTLPAFRQPRAAGPYPCGPGCCPRAPPFLPSGRGSGLPFFRPRSLFGPPLPAGAAPFPFSPGVCPPLPFPAACFGVSNFFARPAEVLAARFSPGRPRSFRPPFRPVGWSPTPPRGVPPAPPPFRSPGPGVSPHRTFFVVVKGTGSVRRPRQSRAHGNPGCPGEPAFFPPLADTGDLFRQRTALVLPSVLFC